MRRHGGVIRVGGRGGFVIEVPEPVLTAHQGRRQPRRPDMAHPGRDIAEPDPDPPLVARIDSGTMHRQRVVERHLPRLQHHIQRLALVHRVGQGLPARQHRFRVRLIEMRALAGRMGPRNDLHTAVLPGRSGQRHPGGDMLERRQPEIGRILVPGHEILAVRFLQPDGGMKHHDVGPDQRLHAIQDARMAHQRGRPGEQQIGLHPVAGLAPAGNRQHRPAAALATGAIELGFRRGQQSSARQVALDVVAFDLGGTQHWGSPRVGIVCQAGA